MNSQLGNSFYSQIDSPLRPYSRNHGNRLNQSNMTNRVLPQKTRELHAMELDLDTCIKQNNENLKRFAVQSEDASENLEEFSGNIDQIESECIGKARKHLEGMVLWGKQNADSLETNFQKKKDQISDFYEKFDTLLEKENFAISEQFENKVRILVNEFQEKRYQRNLAKRKREEKLEEMKTRIFGKLSEAQEHLQDVVRKRKQTQERGLEVLSDLKQLFERRLVQSQRQRDENEMVLAQMLDSVISKFD
jgi:hypothetical protein